MRLVNPHSMGDQVTDIFSLDQLWATRTELSVPNNHVPLKNQNAFFYGFSDSKFLSEANLKDSYSQTLLDNNTTLSTDINTPFCLYKYSSPLFGFHIVLANVLSVLSMSALTMLSLIRRIHDGHDILLFHLIERFSSVFPSTPKGVVPVLINSYILDTKSILLEIHRSARGYHVWLMFVPF